MDVTPAFMPDEASFVFSRLKAGQIVKCNLRGEPCSVVHVDAMIPGFPVPSPDGKTIAYLTGMNAARLRVVGIGGGQARDLGPAADRCAPAWASSTRVWIVQSAVQANLVWAEMDLRTGRPTGVTESVTAQGPLDCPAPNALLDHHEGRPLPRLSVVADESAFLSLVNF